MYAKVNHRTSSAVGLLTGCLLLVGCAADKPKTTGPSAANKAKMQQQGQSMMGRQPGSLVPGSAMPGGGMPGGMPGAGGGMRPPMPGGGMPGAMPGMPR